MYKILIAIICMSMPALCVADDFNYDDDTAIDVSDDNWNDTGDDGTGKPGINIEFDNSSGITQTGTDTDELRFYRDGSDVVIISATDTVMPVYRIGAPAVQMLRLQPGNNRFDLPHGIYIINSRKHLL